MAGHSKWAQIKHKKALTDAKKGVRFSKLVKEIQIAARIGGPNPESNPRLRTAAETARAEGLPKDNIERAIERATGTDTEKLEEFLYEAAAPGGVMIIIEGITDSKNRTHAEIKHLLSKHGARLAEPGSVLWNFKKIGVIEINPEAAHDADDEAIELAAIDAGARDIEKIEGVWRIETPFETLHEVRKKLDAAGFELLAARHEYASASPISVSPENLQTLEPLFEELTDHGDVQEMYTNLL